MCSFCLFFPVSPFIFSPLPLTGPPTSPSPSSFASLDESWDLGLLILGSSSNSSISNSVSSCFSTDPTITPVWEPSPTHHQHTSSLTRDESFFPAASSSVPARCIFSCMYFFAFFVWWSHLLSFSAQEQEKTAPACGVFPCSGGGVCICRELFVALPSHSHVTVMSLRMFADWMEGASNLCAGKPVT